MKKKIVLIVAMLILLIMSIGCEKKENKKLNTNVEQILRWNLGTEPKTLDPQLNSALDAGDVINHCYEGLMRNIKGVMIPGIAESYTVSEDGLVYNFKLREAKWSDGKLISAKDFEYSWKRALNPKTASEYAFIMYMIDGAKEYNNGKITSDKLGIKAIDDKTLEVRLNKPTGYFISLTGFFTFMPVREDSVNQMADGAWAKDSKLAITNGPFKLLEYKIGDKISLVKNENYWNAKNVKLEKLDIFMIVDNSTEYSAYQSGELDVIDNVPTPEIPNLLVNNPDFVILPRLGTYYYIFNMNYEVLKDEKVRRALTYSIDRKAITDTITKGGQLPAKGIVPKGLKDANNRDFNTKGGMYDIPNSDEKFEEAKKLLAEAGYPDGLGFPTLKLDYNTSESHKAVAEAIQEMWKKNLGINVTLSNSEWAVFQVKRKKNDFEITRGGWIGDYADPLTMLEIFVTGASHNHGRWSNLEYDNLIKSSNNKRGQERFKELYKAEKLLMNELPILPIYYYTDILMVNSKVKNWEKNPMGQFYFGNAYIK